mmetsp:Transcript_29957/g.36498  ORF Transcript_29957/g.36498 Transcript_29957/m.36498 type:complete len:174 (+) Transcript_29957:65-586(+)
MTRRKVTGKNKQFNKSSSQHDTTTLCTVCEKVEKKYKCPKCFQGYCGIECCREHKSKCPGMVATTLPATPSKYAMTRRAGNNATMEKKNDNNCTAKTTVPRILHPRHLLLRRRRATRRLPTRTRNEIGVAVVVVVKNRIVRRRFEIDFNRNRFCPRGVHREDNGVARDEIEEC